MMHVRPVSRLVPVSATPVLTAAERKRLQRPARLLAWGGNAWHVAEFAIALAAGVSAGSIALIGFGIDSLIEVLAGSVIVWLFTGPHNRRRRAARGNAGGKSCSDRCW
jgi:hypothetical protein